MVKYASTPVSFLVLGFATMSLVQAQNYWSPTCEPRLQTCPQNRPYYCYAQDHDSAGRCSPYCGPFGDPCPSGMAKICCLGG
ncbi:uncharacterized protein BYT42DRAFT_588396 [Radiomyces spectabilis]|uniref:uncharacterized protein n=1 Tax=Radiomyces spectabilis TaxID=64574 RepID=UPI00221F223C|nr:uncharacterized protein BYT42DRAFT_588396 [Radiomyces spectabilis]KAI8365961.1 hypothetical protein BYT42DRAFT_588396 [Radiomyces spectabilis]